MKAPAIGCLLIVLTSLAATQESRAMNALATLHKLNGSVSWNLSTATAADVDCDGKLDTVLLGSEKDKVAVGIVFSSPESKVQAKWLKTHNELMWLSGNFAGRQAPNHS
jgi:hypothetical protein